jgi:hypothetical protein
MSELGQAEKSEWATGKSALPSRTDIPAVPAKVRKVPTADITPSLRAELGLFRSGSQ